MKRYLTLSALLLITGIIGFASHALALTISPARIELTGNPGETITGEFTLVNNQENAATFYSSTNNFESSGDTGTPSFTSGTVDLASWIQIQPQVTLAKGETVKVPFTITIPKDADAGGHFAAMFLSTNPTVPSGGQVSIGAKIGTLILLRVSGDIKEGGGVTAFGTENNQLVFTSLPVHLQYKFNNTGNDRVEPYGNVIIRDTVYLKTKTLPGNSSIGNVLPGSSRRFTVIWGDNSTPPPSQTDFFGSVAYETQHFALGMYTAQLSLQYGSSGRADASKIFFVLPWQLLIVVGIILLILFFVFGFLLKRYNRWIIAKARQQPLA